jgi:hypothetical protein
MFLPSDRASRARFPDVRARTEKNQPFRKHGRGMGILPMRHNPARHGQDAHATGAIKKNPADSP